MPQDDFEKVLERCREGLSEITLSVPDLDAAAPRVAVVTLEPAPVAAPPAPPPVVAKPVLPPAPAEILKPAPQERPQPAPRAPVEDGEIFPPFTPRPPSTPLPALKNADSPGLAAPAPAQAAPAPRRRGAAFAAAATAAAGCLFFVWRERRAPDLALEIDSADAVVVRPDKGDVLAARGKELIDMTLSGQPIRNLPLDAPVDSLHWDQGSLWTADGVTPSVVEHPDGGKASVFTLNHIPAALYIKDKYLWTAEKDAHAIRQFQISRSILGAMLQPIDRYELPGLSPETFAVDADGDLWLIDSLSRKLCHLRLADGTFKLIASAPLSPIVGPTGKLRGLTIDGSAVWFLSSPASGGRDVLRRIALGELLWTPA